MDGTVQPEAGVEARFWAWFANNEEALFHFEREQELVFDMLAAELGKVDPDLTFEFGPVLEGRREFVISAGGLRRAFGAVEALYRAAPRLARWVVTAFRPRRPVDSHAVAFRGVELRPEDVECTVLRSPTQLGLYVYLRGLPAGESTTWKQIGYLFLDQALGEYDVETKIGLIEILPFEAHPELPHIPLRQVPAAVDRAWTALVAAQAAE